MITFPQPSESVLARWREGLVIPAHPLALTAARKWDERRQRALTRYYLAAGAGGLAVGVHTTQFAIREPRYGLYRPVLELAMETIRAHEASSSSAHSVPIVSIAGICGGTAQAIQEAELARELGYHAGLLSLAALKEVSDSDLIEHCQRVAHRLPIVGFYLQPAVGGRILSHTFWRAFCEIPNVIGVKIAPFNRYQTWDVVRAVAESGREEEITLYTGNDDQIVLDLVTPFRVQTPRGEVCVRIRGGLLGHWACWTRRAVDLLAQCQRVSKETTVPSTLLTLAAQITDCNAAFFDPSHHFAGSIPGIHEVLRRQGLLAGRWCLDEHEELSPGQCEEIDRVSRAYPHLNDDVFVAEHLDEWLS